LEAVFGFPGTSVTEPPFIRIVRVPLCVFAVGVAVNVYVFPEALREEIIPPTATKEEAVTPVTGSKKSACICTPPERVVPVFVALERDTEGLDVSTSSVDAKESLTVVPLAFTAVIDAEANPCVAPIPSPEDRRRYRYAAPLMVSDI
jgi:hypothetical protein